MWTYIPLDHFIVPLLHLLIGLWNDIWDKFWEIVSGHLEYIDTEEADARSKKESLEQKIVNLRIARDSWKSTTEDGKIKLQAESKRTRLRKALKDLRLLNNIVGIDTTSSKSPVTKFLSDLEDFIDEEVVIGEDSTQGEEDEGEQEELVATEIETQNVEVQKRLKR